MPPIVIDLPDEAATARFGEDLALALKPGDCLALSGDLGAGKSTLARALIRAMADDPGLEVPSPTFTLVQGYELRFPVAHFDLYRIADPSELDELGLDEALQGGVVLVEWPENAADALPAAAIRLRLENAGAGRRATLGAEGPSRARIERSLRIRAFLAETGLPEAERRYLLGDASPRGYERIRRGQAADLILMDAPRLPSGPIVRDGKPYTALAHIATDVRAFVAIDVALRERGLSAPEILGRDMDDGLVLIEDFGTAGVLDAEGAPIPERYAATIDVLAHLHGEPPPEAIPLPGGHIYRVPPFDPTAMTIEVEQLLSWYVPWKLGRDIDPAARADFDAIWADLVARAQGSEQSLLLRDVHSPNLFWLPERDGVRRIGLSDFQDAMIGPSAYDVASLVQDARVTVPPALAEKLLAGYHAARSADPAFDAEVFAEAYAIMAAQRATKILGIFVRLKLRDGKPGYLRHLPRIETYLRTSLGHPVLHPLRDWYRQVGILSDES
ncbi:MAG: tRNA (adenosine(37)-N6)-threonylcarbamoyltransferase complex ATPase subunit type 1 TsaE [Pararhizobium sp.]